MLYLTAVLTVLYYFMKITSISILPFKEAFFFLKWQNKYPWVFNGKYLIYRILIIV